MTVIGLPGGAERVVLTRIASELNALQVDVQIQSAATNADDLVKRRSN
jgi:hypothetical protein